MTHKFTDAAVERAARQIYELLAGANIAEEICPTWVNIKPDARKFYANLARPALETGAADLIAQLADCEQSLAIYDQGRVSEYWARYKEPT